MAKRIRVRARIACYQMKFGGIVTMRSAAVAPPQRAGNRLAPLAVVPVELRTIHSVPAMTAVK